MSRIGALIKQTWLDWAVFGFVVVTATRCKSPILIVFFSIVALVVAVVCVRKTWRMVRLASSGAPRSASEAGAHHRSGEQRGS